MPKNRGTSDGNKMKMMESKDMMMKAKEMPMKKKMPMKKGMKK